MTRGILLIGFGGPTRPEDIRPFLANVLRGRPVPPHRVDEVARQYERIGGRSPYNACAEDLARALERHFASDRIPVYVGMRNWAPTLADTLARVKADGVTDLTCLTLAPYRSRPSWNYYVKSTAEAYHAVGGRGLRLRHVQPWYREPLFEEAIVRRVEASLAGLTRVRCLFSAHAIPLDWDRESGYSGQITDLAARVARRCGVDDWRVVYQSRSGRPEDPWLEPDIAEVLSTETPDGRDVLVVPLGFIMDHVEVLFDLDVKAREAAEARGWRFHRAKTVGTHPLFVEMLARRVRWSESPTPPRGAGPPRRVAVVGAGISGLAAAHRLTERGGNDLRLTVIDAAPRAGGLIETQKRDGFLWENGPDSFITDKPALLNLAARLGVEDRLIGTNPDHRRSFIARHGRLYPTPDGFYLLAPSKIGPFLKTPLLSWRGKARAALELLIPPRRTGGDESLASFVRRRFGPEILERLAQPLVAGIYSADPETLSLEATFPRFLEMERKTGGVIRALLQRGPAPAGTSGPRYGLFASFRDGMETLVHALVQRLPPDTFRLETSVSRLDRSGEAWRLHLSTGESLTADAVCLALPAPRTAALLEPVSPRLAALIAGIPQGSVATLHAAYDRRRIGHPLEGFGFVVPASEKRVITGCTFAHVKFPGRAPAGYALLRVFLGGPAIRGDDHALRNRALADLGDFLGIEGPPLWTTLRRYPAAMPQYQVGHTARVRRIFALAAALPGLALAGNAYHGIGLPDSVAAGEHAAEALLAAAPALTPR